MLIRCWGGALLACLSTTAAHGAIGVAPMPCGNVRVVAQTADRVAVELTHPVHNWFAGRFTGLPTDGRQVTIEIRLPKEARYFKPDVRKWQGLRPLATYAPPNDAAAYRRYGRDADGRWARREPWVPRAERAAGSGTLPDQAILPPNVASSGLSADGKLWCPWFDVASAVDVTRNTLVVTVTPLAAELTLALHVPYSAAYHDALCDALQAAAPPGVHVDTLGKSAGGRSLRMIRVDEPGHDTPLRMDDVLPPTGFAERKQRTVFIDDPGWQPGAERPRVVFVFAREHGTEAPGSWVTLGVLEALTAATPEAAALRRGRIWLLLPIIDPDGVESSHFNDTEPLMDVVQDVGPSRTRPEAVALALYLRAFAHRGRQIVSSPSLFSYECAEAPNISTPMLFMADNNSNSAREFNKLLFARMVAAGYTAGQPDAPAMAQDSRPNGWLMVHYRTLPLTIEINDRWPARRLSLDELVGMGRYLAEGLLAVEQTPVMQARQKIMAGLLAADAAKRARVFKANPLMERFASPVELLGFGF